MRNWSASAPANSGGSGGKVKKQKLNFIYHEL